MSPTETKMLIIDDDPDIIEFLKYNLTKEGYQVETAMDGEEGIAKATECPPHLILLDVMMPNLDGIETCYLLREKAALQNTLISFLSARGEEYSEIAGLEAGADDYIQKPIRPRLLITRIKALLRRHVDFRLDVPQKTINLGDLIIDKDRIEVLIKGASIELARKEFEILYLLASRPGKVYTRDEIYRHIWGTEVIVGNRTIDVHISKLRDKVGSNYIKTIKGIGYKLAI